MGLEWLLFGLSALAYLALLAHGLRHSGHEVLKGLVPMAGVLIVVFARREFADASLLGTLRLATITNCLIIVSTLGKPHRLMDAPGWSEEEDDDDAWVEPTTEERRIAASQLTFLVLLIAGVAGYEISGWTYFD